MACFLTAAGSFLPGSPIDNDQLPAILGELPGEAEIRKKILQMNGIKKRFYALDGTQNATHTVYELAALAAERCLEDCASLPNEITYLSVGTTYAPLHGPGVGTLVHSELKKRSLISHPLEINSSSGICSSGAQAIVNAYRAVITGDHESALCIGVEQPSDILKSSVMQPIDDRHEHESNIRRSKWFMATFLRFMLSDGAGAFHLQNRPAANAPSFEICWTYSQSFANETPLCMKLESKTLRLTQDVEVLAEHLVPCGRRAVSTALRKHDETLSSYRMILPHMSSLYFQKFVLKVLQELSDGSGPPVEHWTNLSHAGNTGSASIFILLDEYRRTHELRNGDKLLLFIPESAQFNFVIISLKVVLP